MKTKALLFITMLVLGSVVYANTNKGLEKAAAPLATSSLSGIVLDKSTGEALTGVEIKLEGTNKSTYTDFHGKFIFENIKPGNYQISASFISYNDAHIGNIKVENNELHALNLKLTSVTR